MGEVILRTTLPRAPDRAGLRRCRACGTPARAGETHCREGCFFERVSFHGFALDAIRSGDQYPIIMGGAAIHSMLARAPRPGES